MALALPASIGVISDTHGSLDQRALDLFEEVDLIIHAGDVGDQSVLLELESVAPVVAVRGNTDEARWAEDLPPTARITVGPYVIDIAHDPHSPPPPGAAVVVRGHTHRPLVESVQGCLHVNPGSASHPRGPGAVPTVALLEIGEDGPRARIRTL